MTAEAIERDLRKQIGIIGEAITRVRAGVLMNISDVEQEVARLCMDINKLPPGEAQTLESSMAEMIGKLEDLAAALSDFQEKGGHGAH